MSELMRFSVAMPEDLMDELDRYTARRGIAKNRSEAIRDLVRGALIEEEVEDPESSIFGTLTMVFNHHSNDLRDKLDAIQHEHVDEIVSTVHVHLDEENCLEVVLMRGQSQGNSFNCRCTARHQGRTAWQTRRDDNRCRPDA